MRVHQLLESQEPLFMDVPDQIKLVEKECSDAVNLYRKTKLVLLRGEAIRCRSFESDIRQSRKPIQMKKRWHASLIQAFDNLGLSVNRNNSIFCTTSNNIASNWGECYVIFPKNGWKGLVFDEVKKGYVFDALQKPLEKADVKRGARDIITDVEDITAVLHDMKPHEFNAKTAAPILQERFEDILITGSGYYAFRNTHVGNLTDIKSVLYGLGLGMPQNLGTHWETVFDVDLDAWKKKVLERYPKATFDKDPDHEEFWHAMVGNQFVGRLWLSNTRKGKPFAPSAEVYLHPKDF